MIARGFRRIGPLGSLPQAYPSLADRRRDYLQAHHDHDIERPYFADCHMYVHEAAQAAEELLARAPEITALFCCNDLMAIAAMQAAQGLGRYLPDDLSVVGSDAFESAAHVTPALTTMRVDKVSMGRLAVQLPLNRVAYPDSSCVTAVLRPTLVERASVRESSTA
jgi:LacI family transcriptional regulator